MILRPYQATAIGLDTEQGPMETISEYRARIRRMALSEADALIAEGGLEVKVSPPGRYFVVEFRGDPSWIRLRCPYGKPGDRLWVRETFCTDVRRAPDLPQIVYAADYVSDRPQIRWRPSIHMPRWASRITLEITCVRVERLQAISEADAIAEGCERPCVPIGPQFMRGFYRGVWESINGPGSWDANPLVWVIEFRRLP